MNRKQLQLEGNSVEEVLKKVADTFGSTAHVIGVEKVRTPGLGGFFAREYVVATVEVPSDLLASHSGNASRSGNAAHSGNAVHSDNAVRKPVHPTQPTRRQAEETPSAPAHLTGLEAMLAAADQADGFAGEPHTTTTSMPDVEILPPTPLPQLQARPQPQPVTWPHLEPPAPDDFAKVFRSAQALAQEVAHDFNALPAELEEAPRTDAPIGASVGTETNAGTQGFENAEPEGVTLAELAEIGIPRAILEKLPAGRPRYTLSQVMKHVPAAPNFWLDNDSVLVILGAGISALPTAKIMSAQLGLGEHDITAAGPHSAAHSGAKLVLTAQSARDVRTRARAQNEPVIVFLDIGPNHTDWYLAARLIQALDPDHIMAAVRATHDMAHNAQCLTEASGGRTIDALAVEGVVGSSAPARALHLGIPVSHIDQIPVNPVIWAAAVSTALPHVTWD